MRTWVEGSQMRGDHALAGASNQLGYKEYTQQDLSTKHQYDTNSNKITNNNAEYTPYWWILTTDLCRKLTGVGRDNIYHGQLYISWRFLVSFSCLARVKNNHPILALHKMGFDHISLHTCSYFRGLLTSYYFHADFFKTISPSLTGFSPLRGVFPLRGGH